jgi:hypothetical protein
MVKVGYARLPTAEGTVTVRCDRWDVLEDVKGLPLRLYVIGRDEPLVLKMEHHEFVEEMTKAMKQGSKYGFGVPEDDDWNPGPGEEDV